MSKGGSDDAWQAQDDAGSLKPGRFRAYLADQLSAPSSPSAASASRSIPFPRETGSASSSNRRDAKVSANKGKARQIDRGFMTGFDQSEAAASTSLGKRLATGFGFRQAASKPSSKQVGSPALLRSGPTASSAHPPRAIQSLHPSSNHTSALKTVMSRAHNRLHLCSVHHLFNHHRNAGAESQVYEIAIGERTRKGTSTT